MSRVLILREAVKAATLINALTSEGMECAALPVTLTEFITPKDFNGMREPWIALTSANGARGLYRALEKAAHALPPHVRVATVGAATAEAFHALFGREADLVSPVADGAHLAEHLSKSLPAGTEILYPCPGGHDSEFAVAARAGGLTVHEMPVYRTLPVAPERLTQQLTALLPRDYVVFYAPSAVRALANALPQPWDFTAVAIGPTTQRALIVSGLQDIIVAADPSAEAVANAILFEDCNDWESEHA